MTNQQIVRRLEALETSMGAHDNAAPLEFEIVFIEAVEGCPGGRIKRIVKLSELGNAKSEEG